MPHLFTSRMVKRKDGIVVQDERHVVEGVSP